MTLGMPSTARRRTNSTTSARRRRSSGRSATSSTIGERADEGLSSRTETRIRRPARAARGCPAATLARRALCRRRADIQRAREHRRPSSRRSRMPCPMQMCWSSTTTVPTAPAARPSRPLPKLGQIKVLHRPGKQGLGAAYRHGFTVALDEGYEVDRVDGRRLLPRPGGHPGRCCAPIEAGADAVIGSRYVPGGGNGDWPLHRRLLSRWGNRYTASVSRPAVSDCTSGFRAYRARRSARIEPGSTTAEGYAFLTELVRRLVANGSLIVETPDRVPRPPVRDLEDVEPASSPSRCCSSPSGQSSTASPPSSPAPHPSRIVSDVIAPRNLGSGRHRGRFTSELDRAWHPDPRAEGLTSSPDDLGAKVGSSPARSPRPGTQIASRKDSPRRLTIWAPPWLVHQPA